MKKNIDRFNTVNIGLAVLLLAIRLAIGIYSNSIAVISDAINIATDVLAASAAFYLMRLSIKKADFNHPYGHSSAEPIGAFIIAKHSCVAGIEIMHSSVMRLIEGATLNLSMTIIAFYGATILLKGIMYAYSRIYMKRIDSQAIKAITIDHRNDILMSLGILAGIISVKWLHYYFMDAALGTIIGLFVIYSGWNIGKDNIKYLMGESASDTLLKKIKNIAERVPKVKGVHDIKAHYIGLVLNVEVHIELDRRLTLKESHDIGKKVQKAVESLVEVNKAFVHIDPYYD